MLMATFIHSSSDHFYQGCYYPYDRFNYFNEIGFVCTGDYPINTDKKKKTIMEHYLREQCLLHEMMAPHHGADDCYKYMPFGFMRKAYVQYKKDDKKHPGPNI
ncbi:hypothetical protein AGMMS49546_09250 [Spirochaetia bacterium]|nr:hypothetical protein AGMMS49546_09250 [Spirochaetia bacterium]